MQKEPVCVFRLNSMTEVELFSISAVKSPLQTESKKKIDRGLVLSLFKFTNVLDCFFCCKLVGTLN